MPLAPSLAASAAYGFGAAEGWSVDGAPTGGDLTCSAGTRQAGELKDLGRRKVGVLTVRPLAVTSPAAPALDRPGSSRIGPQWQAWRPPKMGGTCSVRICPEPRHIHSLSSGPQWQAWRPPKMGGTCSVRICPEPRHIHSLSSGASGAPLGDHLPVRRAAVTRTSNGGLEVGLGRMASGAPLGDHLPVRRAAVTRTSNGGLEVGLGRMARLTSAATTQSAGWHPGPPRSPRGCGLTGVGSRRLTSAATTQSAGWHPGPPRSPRGCGLTGVGSRRVELEAAYYAQRQRPAAG